MGFDVLTTNTSPLDPVKITEKITRENAFGRQKKKPVLNLTPG